MSGSAQTASIWSKYMYPIFASPGYRAADAIDCAAAVVVILAATVLRSRLVRLSIVDPMMRRRPDVTD